MDIREVLSRVGDPERYPEAYLNWYRQVYKPQQGSSAVGMDNAVNIWRALRECGGPQAEDDENYVPSL